MSRTEIYAQVEQERVAQDKEWGGPEHDDENTAGGWLEILRKHWAKANAAPLDHHEPLFRQQMIRVAALAVATVEWFDRREARQAHSDR
jgi:hypothetical protein